MAVLFFALYSAFFCCSLHGVYIVFLLYRVFCSSLHSVINIVARFIALLFFASWGFLFSFCFIQFFAPRFIALLFVLCCFSFVVSCPAISLFFVIV